MKGFECLQPLGRIDQDGLQLVRVTEPLLVDLDTLEDVAVRVAHRRGLPIADHFNEVYEVHTFDPIHEMLWMMTVLSVVMVQRDLHLFEEAMILRTPVCAATELRCVDLEDLSFW